MKNIITLFAIYICLITSSVAQDCALTANVISFENSQKGTLAVYFRNQTVIGINTTMPSGKTSALLIQDSLGTILSIVLPTPEECPLYYRLLESDFIDRASHNYYDISEISFDTLESSLTTRINIDEVEGCIANSNKLRVVDYELNSLTEIATLPDNIDEEDLNVFGGGTTINGVLNQNSETSISICRIDSLNQSFSLLGAAGPFTKWVVTSREGVVIAALDNPVFDFQSYFENVDISSTLHELELFHIAYSGGGDWLDIGNNIKTDLCNSPTSNRSTLYEINLVECANTCSDNYLNGLEIEIDECMIDSTLACIISGITNVECFGASTGSATVEVISGVGPFSYLWDSGDTTSIAANLSAGTWDVTVSDAIGTDVECTTIINQPDSLALEIQVNAVANCSASATVTGGQQPYQYLWSTDQTTISISMIDSVQSVTVTDVSGCTVTATIDADALAMACGDCSDGIKNGNEVGVDCGGDCEPCPDVVDTLNLNPLQVTKLAVFVDENDNGFMELGETISYTFSVCNAGTSGLTDVSIDDPLVTVQGDAISLDGVSCNPSAFTGTYTLTAADLEAGMITNQATATARLQDTITVTDLSDDPSVLADVDTEDDGEPDDPTILMLTGVGPCGVTFIDTDMDGICNAEDDDDDNDDVLDVNDRFPLDPSENTDTDGDGFGDNGDFDDDNDSVDDRFDAFPLDATESIDSDGDGIGDNADTNDDGDACDDVFDNDPLVASESCMIDTGCDSMMVFDNNVVFGGTILTDIGFAVDSVELTIANMDSRVLSLTDTVGVYSSDTLPLSLDYLIRPSKEDKPFVGVSTLDMLFIQRHILRLERLSNPYKIIAADVSGNAGISIVDIIVIRQMILGVVDQWNDGLSWKFVDAEFDFFDPFVPWPFRNAVEVSNADISRCNIDFVAIKIGDVDNSFEKRIKANAEIRDNKESQLRYRKQELDNGYFHYSFFMPENDLLYGFQFGLVDLHSTDIDIQAASLDIAESDFAVSTSDLKLSWTNPYGQAVRSEEVLFTLVSKEEIDFDHQSADIASEMYKDESIETYTLHLLEEKGAMTLDPVFTPNPFQASTSLSMTLDKSQLVKVNVYDASGVVHWSHTERLSAGTQSFDIPEYTLQNAGMYFYTIESGDQRYSGKLIKSN